MNDRSMFDLWPMFDSYVKKVVRSANNDYGRAKARDQKIIILDDTVIMACIHSPHRDSYVSDHFYLVVDGTEYPLDDPALYAAMQQIPEKLQKVLVLKFWHCDDEKTIASKLNVTIRACYTRRKKALELLKSILEAEKK